MGHGSVYICRKLMAISGSNQHITSSHGNVSFAVGNLSANGNFA